MLQKILTYSKQLYINNRIIVYFMGLGHWEVGFFWMESGHLSISVGCLKIFLNGFKLGYEKRNGNPL